MKQAPGGGHHWAQRQGRDDGQCNGKKETLTEIKRHTHRDDGDDVKGHGH